MAWFEIFYMSIKKVIIKIKSIYESNIYKNLINKYNRKSVVVTENGMLHVSYRNNIESWFLFRIHVQEDYLLFTKVINTITQYELKILASDNHINIISKYLLNSRITHPFYF